MIIVCFTHRTMFSLYLYGFTEYRDDGVGLTYMGKCSELGVFTVFGLYIYKLISFAKNKMTLLPTLGYCHNYSTRNKQHTHLSPNAYLSNLRKLPLIYAWLKYYNNLPMQLKNVTDNNKFKQKLKQILLSTLLYSLIKFLRVVSLSFYCHKYCTTSILMC